MKPETIRQMLKNLNIKHVRLMGKNILVKAKLDESKNHIESHRSIRSGIIVKISKEIINRPVFLGDRVFFNYCIDEENKNYICVGDELYVVLSIEKDILFCTDDKDATNELTSQASL